MIVIAIAVIIGFLTVSNSGNTRDIESSPSINHVTRQNVENESMPDTAEENNLLNYLEDETVTINKMMTDMKNIWPKGNPSIDFLYSMIPHHESAIVMAKSYLKNGAQNTELKQIAEHIIKAQNAEIEEMQSMIQKLEANLQKDEVKEKEYLNAYHKMMEDHMASQSINTPNSVDQAFAEGMIRHHEMAIRMAKTVLAYTEDKEVSEMAKHIIDTQNKEIAKMREIVSEINSGIHSNM